MRGRFFKGPLADYPLRRPRSMLNAYKIMILLLRLPSIAFPLTLAVALAGAVAGCSTGLPLARYAPEAGARDSFVFCHGYGCRLQQEVGITDKEWRSVQQIFKRKPAKTAQDERARIALAIGRIEAVVGTKTGTNQDRAEAARLRKDVGQLDCIDETVNTHRYLGFLEEAGLLRFHKRILPVHRGYFVDGSWPHNAAMIEEVETQQKYVVDAFYRANGEAAHIIPRAQWLGGWRPE